MNKRPIEEYKELLSDLAVASVLYDAAIAFFQDTTSPHNREVAGRVADIARNHTNQALDRARQLVTNNIK